MSRSAKANPSSFPHWVALCSLGLVLWLFFGNTVPALHEREQLRAVHDELSGLRARYDQAIADAQLGRGRHADYDLQGLFLAIDQRGYTPAELCAAYPQPAAADEPSTADAPKAKFQ